MNWAFQWKDMAARWRKRAISIKAHLERRTDVFDRQGKQIAELISERDQLREALERMTKDRNDWKDRANRFQFPDAVLSPPVKECRGCGQTPCIDTSPGEQDPDHFSIDGDDAKKMLEICANPPAPTEKLIKLLNPPKLTRDQVKEFLRTEGTYCAWNMGPEGHCTNTRPCPIHEVLF